MRAPRCYTNDCIFWDAVQAISILFGVTIGYGKYLKAIDLCPGEAKLNSRSGTMALFPSHSFRHLVPRLRRCYPRLV